LGLSKAGMDSCTRHRHSSSPFDGLRSGIVAFRRKGDASVLLPVADSALGGITQC
jgi:hypothetical protein